MYSELECGICYSVYNTGRRCPRELSCGHTFCEICLVTLSQPLAPQAAGVLACPEDAAKIVCPLCRSSSVLGTLGVRHALRVDEEVLGRILASGVLEMCPVEGSEEENNEGGGKNHFENTNPVVERSTSPRSRKGKLWRSVKRFCGRLIGDSSHNFRRRVNQCMTEADVRDLALMSCYMM